MTLLKVFNSNNNIDIMLRHSAWWHSAEWHLEWWHSAWRHISLWANYWHLVWNLTLRKIASSVIVLSVTFLIVMLSDVMLSVNYNLPRKLLKLGDFEICVNRKILALNITKQNKTKFDEAMERPRGFQSKRLPSILLKLIFFWSFENVFRGEGWHVA